MSPRSRARSGSVLPFVLLALAALVGTAALPVFAKPSQRAADTDADAAKTVYDPSLFQGISWRNIGPFRGGRSTAVAGVVQDPQTYYFGGVGGGIFKTTDGGLHWQNISDGKLATGSVGALAVAPSDRHVVWAGMGESCARGVMTTHGDGVYRSIDGGTTWTHLGLEDTRVISEIEVHPGDPDTAWVAAQGHLWGPNEERGVYKTTDGGQTWKKVLYVDEHTGAADLSLDPHNPRILYAAMWRHQRTSWKITSGGRGDEATSGIYKSTDGGETWNELTQGLPEEMGKIGVSVSGADGSRVYAIVEATIPSGEDDDKKQDEKPAGGGLYRSDDAGQSWKLMSGDRPLWTRSWYYMHVFAHPTDADTVWVLNAPALRSEDGGRTFAAVRTPHGDNHDLWINPSQPQYLVEANDGGANVSTNAGATWSTQSNQPTAQFYRVATDRQFPYQVYGGQQDNTALTIQSRAFDAGITERNWWDIGGCESADPAFDPDDPRYVYAGCYQGSIDEWDRETQQTRDVSVRPVMNLGRTPSEMRHRFNWNAPILVSRHDPGVIYHGGNLVLRSDDRGRSWTEISPDLTRDEEAHQVDGGGPFTVEGAGGEVFGTLLALAESPHDAQVLWTGSDDGLVHVTRDGGATWQDVSPKGLGEAMINTVEASPHRAGAAYLAVTRHKWDDLRPMIFRTNDFGATWSRRDQDLPENTIVRVVREDPAREGLLYAGTERGVFVSWDDGERWQKLELGFPTVPVTDLEVHDADLVASTHGRAFWILDDLTPIRALTDEMAASTDMQLLAPQPAYLVPTPPPWYQPPPALGKNPGWGVFVRYLVPKPTESEATEAEATDEQANDSDAGSAEEDEPKPVPLVIEVFDQSGELVRRATSADEKKEHAPPPSVEPGLQTWNWDLTWQQPAELNQKGVITFTGGGAPEVAPGTYTIRLTRGETVLATTAEVRLDPHADVTEADYAPRRDFLLAVRGHLHDIYNTANRLAEAKAQVKAWQERVKSAGLDDEAETAIKDAGKTLLEAIDEVDGQIVQRKTGGFQDIINFPNRLDADFGALLGSVGGATPPVNEGAREVLSELEARWTELSAQAEKVLDQGVADFAQVLADQGIGLIVVPEPKPIVPEVPQE